MKKSLCLSSCSLFPSESHVQKLQKSMSLNNFFPKSFTTHLETSHGTLVCCNTPVGIHCSRINCLLILSLTSLKNEITDKITIDLFHSHLEITINEKDLDCLYIYRPICNYRLISILSLIAKIFETLFYVQIENYFSSPTIISNQQFGFRKGYSTEMAIIDLQNKFQ